MRFHHIAAAGLAVAGCGHDIEYTGLGERSLTPPVTAQPAPAGGGEGAAGAGDPGVLEAEDLTGRTYRFTSLALTAPITGALAEPLNGYFADEIAAGNLNVLMAVTEHSPVALAFDVGPGESASRLECTLTGATFETAATAQLEFPNALLDPPALPIQELALSGRFDAAGEEVTAGTLTGALAVEDAGAITLLGTDFVTFLAGLEVAPDLDLDGDGEADAYSFVGDYEAALLADGEER